MEAKRLAVGTMGFIETVSLDKNRPGKVIVKLSLQRQDKTMEALAALSDAQLPVAVTLDSLQAAMEIPEREPGLTDRLRQDVEEAAQ